MNLQPTTYNLRTRSGFTLIELMVSLVIFTAFVGVALGSFTYALRSQRQARAMISANSNVSLTIEQIAREMRTGFDFCIRGNDPLRPEFSGGMGCTYAPLGTFLDAAVGDMLVFTNANGDKVAYGLGVDKEIQRAVNGGNFVPLTSSDVFVENLRFIIQGANGATGYGDTRAQRITISITVHPKDASLGSGIGRTTLQTTISPRFPA